MTESLKQLLLCKPRDMRDPEPVYEHGDLKVDLTPRRVWLARKEVRLSPLQYALLAALVRRAGRVVHQTRHRIEREPARPRHLKTEPAVGYRLEAADE